jgi:hypothetical protein
MQIKEIISFEEKTKYNRLAKEIGNIFNTLDWLKIFENKIKIFGIYENEKNLIGGFCLYEKRIFCFKIYQNPPFTPCIGPILQIEAQSPVTVMDRWKEAMGLMAKTIDSLPYSVISISLNRDVVDTQPFIWKKFKVIPGYTYILNLEEPIEDIQKRMSKERRNDVNKAITDMLVTRQISDFKIVRSLVLLTFSRQKKTINKFYLDKILFRFANKNNSFAFVAFDKEKPIAVTFCVYDKNTAYYLLGGYDCENKHHGAGALSIWEAIKYAKNLGLKYFDFEGSMIPSIERYFRGFGGKLTPYYRINKARLPLEIILKFFKRELF